MVPLKHEKCVSIVNAFQKVLNKPERKPNKIWIDKWSEFYNRTMKSLLEKNGIEIQSTHNKGKSVVAERFIRTLKNKIYKHMASVSESLYIDKLDDIINEYNNTYHKTTKMNPIDVKANAYIDSIKKDDGKHPQFQVGNHVRISKYKNILLKDTFQIRLKKFL